MPKWDWAYREELISPDYIISTTDYDCARQNDPYMLNLIHA
jgi:hypothetical protein